LTNNSNVISTSKINLWKESLAASVSSIIGFSLSIVTVIIITRFLSVNDVGLYFFYLALIYIGIQIPKGIGIALKKRVSSTNDEEEWIKYLLISTIMTFCILFIISILSSSLFYINNFIAIDIELYGLLSVNFTMYCYSILILSKSYLAGIGQPAKSSEIKNYVGNGLKIILIFTGLYFYPSYYIALLVYGFAYLTAGIICLYVSFDSVKFYKFDSKSIKEILIFVKWSIPNTMLNDMYSRLDTLILGVFIGTKSVGYYDVSQRFGYISSFIGVGVSKVSNIKISGMYESNMNVEDISSKSISASSLFAYPFLIILLLYSESILGFVFGSSYIGAKYFLMGLGVQQVLKCYTIIHESILNAIDMPKKILLPSLVSLVTNIVTAIPLVLYIGGIGVILSTIFADIVRLIFLRYKLKRELNNLKIHKSIFIQIFVFIILLILFYIINFVFLITSIIQIFITSVLIIVLYYILMYVFSPLFREIIKDIVE